MQFLKQSTSATLKIGPFLDDTDGKTAETGLTISQADVRLSKNGGDIAQKNEATSCTHDELGIYGCPIDATDTATLGRLQLWVHESGALPVWHEYMILPANVYDSLFSTDKLEVDLKQIGGVEQSQIDLKDFADAGYDPATNKVQGVVLVDTVTTLTGHTAQTGDNYARLGAPAGASVSADILTIDNFVDELESRLTAVRAGYLDNLSAGAVALASVCTAARLAELDAANLPAEIDGLQGTDGKCLISTDAQDLSASLDVNTKTFESALDLTTNMKNSVNAEADTALSDIHLDHLFIRANTAQAGAAGSITLDSGASAVDAFYDGQVIILTGGTGAGQSRRVDTYTGATKVATVTPNWGTTPDNTTTFVLFGEGDVPGASAPTAGQVADAVWDEAAGDHVGAGTFGQQCGTDIDTLITRIPAEVAQKAHLVNGTGDITPPTNKGIWDALGDGTKTISGLNDIAQSDILADATPFNGADIAAILVDTGTTLETHFVDIKGTGFVKDTHSLPQCLTATGFSTHAAADIWTVGTRALTDKAGFALSAAGIDAIWDETITGHATADSFGLVFDNQIDGMRAYGDSNWATADVSALALEATLTALKGAGWTDENLKAIQDYVDCLPASMGDIVTKNEAGVIDNIWDEEIVTGHDTADTAGEQLNDAAAGSDPNAIADQVWDELQSGHTTAGTFGKYLDAQISGIGGAVGSGALSCTWTQYEDDGTTPMDNVQVWISTDVNGANVVAGTLLTDANGEVDFMLDAGTYYVWREKAGYNFTNPQTWTVS